ncbi:alpha/beta hydrolase [Chitinophaga vietnamensis]|uniref:alpha/beta hydrolase n=1 Tax=Chitinophaga vietnamensis TaxID=2593957 RepID=UPI001178AA76|nr:alpha/beta hydrolase [Chitinophaga vietnamensis]
MNVLFIQGAGEGAYALDRLLVEQLQKYVKGNMSFHYPPMPREEAPDYEPWKAVILQQLKVLDAPIVLIGHSLGGSVLLKLLSEEKGIKNIKALFLVSAPFWGEPGWEYAVFKLKDDFNERLPVIDHIFIYQAEDDEIVAFAHHKRYADKLPNAVVRTFKKGGHELITAAATLADDIDQLE